MSLCPSRDGHFPIPCSGRLSLPFLSPEPRECWPECWGLGERGWDLLLDRRAFLCVRRRASLGAPSGLEHQTPAGFVCREGSWAIFGKGGARGAPAGRVSSRPGDGSGDIPGSLFPWDRRLCSRARPRVSPAPSRTRGRPECHQSVLILLPLPLRRGGSPQGLLRPSPSIKSEIRRVSRALTNKFGTVSVEPSWLHTFSGVWPGTGSGPGFPEEKLPRACRSPSRAVLGPPLSLGSVPTERGGKSHRDGQAGSRMESRRRDGVGIPGGSFLRPFPNPLRGMIFGCPSPHPASPWENVPKIRPGVEASGWDWEGSMVPLCQDSISSWDGEWWLRPLMSLRVGTEPRAPSCREWRRFSSHPTHP